jgi:DNA-binding SARP family transcriptional activator/tetratricopeptide (TPR) repeat protein
MAERPLGIRLLGELQIIAEGQQLPLPPSKKTRALLAYLVATGSPQRRETLCDLLWEGPDDPRGELRWSLAKIRPLLDAGGAVRLKTDRQRVVFEPREATVDLTAVRQLLDNMTDASVETLKAAVGLFRGEFLDGLDLPACYRFQEWCLAERAAASALRLGALGALVDRLGDHPEEALVHARALVAADPLSEAGHASVIRLLARLGRRREATAQYEQARGVLEREAGVSLSGTLERARLAVGAKALESKVQPAPATTAEKTTTANWTRAAVPFVGRVAERASIDDLVSAAANRRATPVLVVSGEPGIGKSRLLDYLTERMAMVGGRCLRGRAFEAEDTHLYGPWIDALRAVPAENVPDAARQDLALLRPAFGPSPSTPTDRARLFEAFLALLRHMSRQGPLAVMLDDLQWLDTASSALFHYVARMPNCPAGVLFAGAVRPGEAGDNLAVSRMLQALERDERIVQLPLSTLSEAETTALVRAVDPAVDAASVFRESDGNPLFALELSRTQSEGRHKPGRTLQAVIAAQIAAMDEPARGLVAWAAAMGRTFGPAVLARLADLETPALLAALKQLEQRGVIRTAGTDAYDFVHDLVRRAAYQEISQPRRKLMHLQIARVLGAMVETDDDLADDLVRHSELAGDHALAARACAIGGERTLRLFANAEAAALARRGRSHLDRLPDESLRRELMIRILKIEVLSAAGPGMRPLPHIGEELADAVAKAEETGLHAAVATGHYLLSILHQQTGDIARAQNSTIRAADAGRGADRRTHARQLANTARCLIELETEIPRARALLEEAETLLGPLGRTESELQWGRGLIARWAGNSGEAAVRIERALGLAREAQDRWREHKCLTWLAVIEFERGRHAEARDRCRELRVLGERMGEDGAPVADIVEALADVAEGSRLGRLDATIQRLRVVDDKSYLAYALNAAALLCLSGGRQDIAKAYAEEALDVAAVMQRHNEIAIAEAVLAQIRAGGSASLISERVRHLRDQAADGDRFSARTRASIEAASPAATCGARPDFEEFKTTQQAQIEEDSRCHASSLSEASRTRSRKQN